MSVLFTPTRINQLTLKNRFIRSATFTALAEPDGHCGAALTDFLVRLAKAGVGLLITGYSFVQKEGQAGPRQLALTSDDFIPPLKQLTAAIHAVGGKIVLQVAHAGAFSRVKGADFKPQVVSYGPELTAETHQELTKPDLVKVCEAFSQAAFRAKQAGFDGVQFHAAHGYLLSQFLSSQFNRRQDEYGGSLQNRARMLLEILAASRELVGNDFPLLVKMNSQDFSEPGLRLAESLAVGKMLEEAGADALEISGGLLTTPETGPSRTGIRSPADEAYFQQATRSFKEQLRLPVILVGGIRSFTVAEQLVDEGYADLIALSRPFICEPELVQRWQAGDTRPARCVSDNLCFRPTVTGKGLYCVTEHRRAKQ